MLNTTQGKIVIELVRKKARMLRGDSFKPLRLMNSLVSASETFIPEHYLLPFTSSLSRIIEETQFDPEYIPHFIGSFLNKNERCRKQNLQTLGQFATRIEKEFSMASHDAVLAADGAAIAGLYEDAGAFPISEWAALLNDGRYANGSKPKSMAPPAEDWSDKVKLGKATWRRPKPAFMIALFARHIGDPSISPANPMWPHLGTAVLLYKDKISVEEVLHVGARLEQLGEVERGLAIIARIFLELAAWVKPEKLSIPMWERKFAIPIAARRIVIGGRD